MTTETQKSQANPKKRLLIGRILSGISIFFSLASRLWQAWLLPIVDDLAQQGRLHEGDSDGCFYGVILMLPTYFIVPLVAVVAIILAAFGFRLRARTWAIIAWIAAILSLIPMWSAWVQFFGS